MAVRPDIPGWNSFMQQVTAVKPFKRTNIIPLPFIDAPPFNENTIYTSLLLAVENAKVSVKNLALSLLTFHCL